MQPNPKDLLLLDPRHAIVVAFFTSLMCLFPGAPAAAQQEISDAHRLALHAMNLEFSHEHITGSPEELDVAFKAAYDAGYNLACQRGAWLVYGHPDLQIAESVFEYGCETGDPVACLVVGWSLDERAPRTEERDRTWKQAARLFKAQCDDGFTAGCHEYAWFLFENKGLTADPRAALLRWEPACEAGHLASCTVLGVLKTEGGPGVRQDVRAGEKHLEDACKGGFAEACYRQAERQNDSWDVPTWDSTYGPLCEAGHADSCWRLGSQYINGSMQAESEERPYELLVRGCDLKNSKSCREAGRIHQHATPPNDVEAGSYFGRACLLGDIGGCTSQAEMILAERIDGSVKDSTAAFEYACLNRSLPGACTALAIELMRGVDLPRDPVRARALLHRSCVNENSSVDACGALATAYEDGQGGDRDRTTAAKYYRWACNAGHVESCMKRGNLLTNGRGIERDDHEALSMFRRACEGGISAACFQGGTILEEGTYVSRDVVQAIELYQIGCAGGIGDACARQGWLKEEGADSQPDFEAARAAYEEGILLASTEAERRMARLLWNGLGGKSSKKRAKKLAAESCQAGDAVACRGAAFL